MIRTLFSLAALSSLPLMAQTDKPILVKEYESGFVMPENSRSDLCEVFADRTVLTRTMGDLKSVEIRKTRLSGYQKTLAAARKAKLETGSGPVDIPTHKYYGYLRVKNSEGLISPVRVELFEENGHTGTTSFNPSYEAKLLKNFLDLHCS